MQELSCGACLARTGRNEEDIRELYGISGSIQNKLDLILTQTTKTNGRIGRLEDELAENYQNDKELEKRVRQLEDSMLKAYGYVAGISGTIGVIGALIGKAIS